MRIFRRTSRDPTLDEIRLEETMVILRGLSRSNQRALVKHLSSHCMKRCWICHGTGKWKETIDRPHKNTKKGDVVVCFHCIGLGRVWDDEDKF